MDVFKFEASLVYIASSSAGLPNYKQAVETLTQERNNTVKNKQTSNRKKISAIIDRDKRAGYQQSQHYSLLISHAA